MTVIKQKPSLEELTHHGVVGMKWGVRKSNPTGAEIHAARQRQAAREREVQRQDDIATTSTGKTKTAAENKARKAAYDFQTNEDRVTATHLTNGEKAVHVLLFGPLALGTIPLNKLVTKNAARMTDEARAELARQQKGKKK
jgi:hypothetical protein